MIETLFGVSAAKPWKFLGFGEMHPVHDWKTYVVWMQPNHKNSWVWWDAPLFMIETLFGVSAAKP